MIGKIQFRIKDQNITTQAIDRNVKVYAPKWVQAALEKLSPAFSHKKFQIGDSDQFITVNRVLTLTQLVAIARNEAANVTGEINWDLYPGIDRQAVIALRDLAKHCVIIGQDFATHFGGYGTAQEAFPTKQKVYICDLPGLQFQQLYNSGRHVLISKTALPGGALDEEIYTGTVGKSKPSYAQAQADKSGRFIKGKFRDKDVLFDTLAFHEFIAQDFILTATSLNEQARLAKDPLNFKFLAYGVGFFAEGLHGDAKERLRENLAEGVKIGLKRLLSMPKQSRSQIKRLELPFYGDQVKQQILEIKQLCKDNEIDFSDEPKDALAPAPGLVTSTTNCSDPHAPSGNEMNHQSVDAAIAENLEDKANKFNPVCNPAMQEGYTFIFRKPDFQADYTHHRVLNLAHATNCLMKQFTHPADGSYVPFVEFTNDNNKGHLRIELNTIVHGGTPISLEGYGSEDRAAFVSYLRAIGIVAGHGRVDIHLEGKEIVKYARLCSMPEEEIKAMFVYVGIDNYEQFFQDELDLALAPPAPVLPYQALQRVRADEEREEKEHHREQGQKRRRDADDSSQDEAPEAKRARSSSAW